MTSPTPARAIERLRAATRHDHRRLEDDLQVMRRLATPNGQRSMIGRYYDLHAPAECALAPLVADIPGLDFRLRRRAGLLEAALGQLGVRSPAEPSGPVPAIGSTAEALGFLYVLEGSSLGGRVILKTLAKGGHETGMLGFLDPYGPATGEMWRRFLAVLDRETSGDDGRVEAAVAGGLKGFAYARYCLCDEALAA
ncbi:biliverdin-producing heme oxygenase [Faunimonas sp. B44]|uniref:biliverdin-producing heme oxygenase n=1 Tax=Faunimonas sp. B44 TaxID=3461493 RepID=UPI00404402B6